MRFVGVEAAGADVDLQQPAAAALGAQFFRRPAGVAGHRFAQVLEVGDPFAEAAAAGDHLLGLGAFTQGQAALAAQLEYGLLDHDAERLADERRILLGQVPGGGHVHRAELGGQLAADAPHLVDRGEAQQFLLAGRIGEIDHAAAGVLLGAPVGQLGEGLGRRDADADRNADQALDFGLHPAPEDRQWLAQAGEIEEGFIDAVDLATRRQVAQHAHDARR